jgi:hypothetical protein
MRDENSHPQAATWKSRAGRVLAALVGLLVAAAYLWLLLYLLSGKVVVDADIIVFCFLVCGIAAAIGLIFVYRLLPRRKPILLFADSGVVPIQHPPRTEISARAIERLPERDKTYRRAHDAADIAPVLKSHGSKSSAAYTTHDGAGFAAFVTVIGLCFIFAGRFDFGWQFLALAFLAGGAIALVLYRRNDRRQAGGIILLLCMIGLGLVMVRFGFLRYFLGLAMAGGGAVALLLSWRRARESSRPFRVAP